MDRASIRGFRAMLSTPQNKLPWQTELPCVQLHPLPMESTKFQHPWTTSWVVKMKRDSLKSAVEGGAMNQWSIGCQSGECICGNPVPAEEMENEGCAIYCKWAGCETIWYHLECLGLEQRIPAWVCESCKSSGGKGANDGEKLNIARLLMCEKTYIFPFSVCYSHT